MTCPYAHIFGEPGKGFHAPRLFGLAALDTLGTAGLAYATRSYVGGFLPSFALWMVIAEASHIAVGVQTKLLAWMGIDPCGWSLRDMTLAMASLGFNYIHLSLALLYAFCILFIDSPRVLFAVSLGIYVTLALFRVMGRCILTDMEEVFDQGVTLSDIVASVAAGDMRPARGLVEEMILVFGLVMCLIKVLGLSLMRSVYGVTYSCTWSGPSPR